MAGAAHEISITALKERPALLEGLSRAIGRRSLGPRVTDFAIDFIARNLGVDAAARTKAKAKAL
jgi:hypothetical protein